MDETLTKPSQPRCADSPSTPESLIEEWIPKLAINAGAALDAKTQAIYRSIWLEGLGDLPTEVLRAAFQKTLRECAYWPVKVADIRKHVRQAHQTATEQAAETEWECVLDCRRLYWNPDMPGGFSRGMPKLSERVQQACRAAGVFREHESVESLHVWARKKFIESFIRWDDAGEAQNLLPDGEIKRLLRGATQAKALPAPEVDFHALHERGLRYAEQNKLLNSYSEASRDLPAWDPGKRAEIEGELLNYGERFKAAMQKREAANMAGIPQETASIPVGA